jgi:hypothetical protein
MNGCLEFTAGRHLISQSMKTAAELTDLEHSLTTRVLARVEGKGVGRAIVEEAVRRVLAALPSSASAEPQCIAALTARSLPDLASRVRKDLAQEGVVIQEIGIGSAGQHTVVVLRLPATSRPALERVADRSRYSMSYLNGVS